MKRQPCASRPIDRRRGKECAGKCTYAIFTRCLLSQGILRESSHAAVQKKTRRRSFE